MLKRNARVKHNHINIRKLLQNTLCLAVIKLCIYDHEFSATLIQLLKTNVTINRLSSVPFRLSVALFRLNRVLFRLTYLHLHEYYMYM